MKKFGELAESKFIVECLSRNFDVSVPFGDSSPYDLIVTSENINRVQVKSTSTMNNERYHITCGWGRKSKKVYDEDKVDIFAIYVKGYDWYIIPSGEIKTTTINLYPHRLNTVGKYEIYKGAWDLL